MSLLSDSPGEDSRKSGGDAIFLPVGGSGKPDQQIRAGGRRWRYVLIAIGILVVGAVVGLYGDRGHAVLRTLVRDYYALIGDTGGPLTVVDRGNWTELEPGIEIHRLVVTRPHNLSAVTLVALRFESQQYEFAVLSTEESRAAVVGRERGAAVAINGGYFDASGQPLGLLISGGKTVAGRLAQASGRGLFGVRDGTPFVAEAAGLDLTGVTEALQTTPLLVRDGVEEQGFDEPWRVDRRAAVCVDERGRVLFAVSDTILNGLSFSEMAHLMARDTDRGGLGCEQGMNLDGGTSAQLWVADHPEATVAGYTDVPVFLMAFPKNSP